MQRLVVASLFVGCAANNIVNPVTHTCLDIKLMCKDGGDKAGCEREEPKNLKRGARLHMWKCHNDENQDFELIGGRVKNKAAGRDSSKDAELCIDIKAMCKDGTDTPGCKRQSVTELTESAEIQLWTCRGDDAAGRNSSSYGNQKWDLLGNGYWKNAHTGLCLMAYHDEAKSGADATNGAKVQVHQCPGKDEDADPEYVFDFETGDMAEETNAADDTRLFSVGPIVRTEEGSSLAPLAAAAAAALALVAAAFINRRRSPAAQQELPLRAFE